MFRIPKTVSQIDVSASLMSYTFWCSTSIWQNMFLNYCMFGVRKNAFPILQYLHSQILEFRRIFKVTPWNDQKQMTLRGSMSAVAVVGKWCSAQHFMTCTLLKLRFWSTSFPFQWTCCQTAFLLFQNLGFEEYMSRVPRTCWQIRLRRAWFLSCGVDLCQPFYRFWHSALWALSLGVDPRSSRCRSVTTVLQILPFGIVRS